MYLGNSLEMLLSIFDRLCIITDCGSISIPLIWVYVKS